MLPSDNHTDMFSTTSGICEDEFPRPVLRARTFPRGALAYQKKKKKKKPESDRGIYFVLLPPHPLALVASSLMSLTSEIYPLSLSHSHGRQQKSASPAQVPEKRNASSVK